MEKAVFDELSRIIYEKSGIFLSERKKDLVATRLNKRLRATGLKGYGEYLEHLKSGDVEEEIVDFLNVISTNVTNFFREPAHFEEMLKAMNKWYSQGQRRFRIWSAACSSGEEPYTIAMTILHNLPHQKLDVRILATDISTKVLHIAQRGIYGESCVKKIPPGFLESYFTPMADDGKGISYEVSHKLRKMVTFRRMNLSEHPFELTEPFDIIFCRNVMIYFDDAVKEKLVDDFFRLLRPCGLLMTGHSESLSCIKHKLSMSKSAVYMKPETAGA
ncbi:MAG: hypothetical protein A2020_11250 [Lentisphaerae bacterium GWF2_45_14]|nr:MAG: hypothetical protein A2020_11250 [Lentisphaerae bacterium GWF2_45_14]